MRVQKLRSVFVEDEVTYPRFVEPNQAFTPRQIIDQFSRGEISAKSFDETDAIYDDAYSDDNMADNIVEFADYFEAKEFLQTTKVIKQKKKKDDTSVEADAEDRPKEDVEGASSEGS